MDSVTDSTELLIGNDRYALSILITLSKSIIFRFK